MKFHVDIGSGQSISKLLSV